MSTCNFFNAKNGIYILKSTYTGEAYTGIDDPDGLEYEDSQFELIVQLKAALKPWGWTVSKNKNEYERYSFFDCVGKYAGSIKFQAGYYDGVQVIFSTAQDVNKELVENDCEKLTYINKHYKNILRLLKKFTICLQVAVVFSTGETLYTEV